MAKCLVADMCPGGAEACCVINNTAHVIPPEFLQHGKGNNV